MKIHVTIDRLILEGVTVPHGERQALREAVPLGQGIARAVVPSLGTSEGLGGESGPGRTP